MRIFFEDIQTIEAIRPDTKYFLIGYVSIMGTFALFAVLGKPLGAFKAM